MYPTPPDSPDGPSDTEGGGGSCTEPWDREREREKKKVKEERKREGLEKVRKNWGLLRRASCQLCWAQLLWIRVYLFFGSLCSPSSVPE